jgi:RNA polymerase sigma-70 factor (ECF subfamily)
MAGFADVEIPEDLARAVIAGDRRAHGRAFELVSPAVMSVAWRMLGTRSSAEEVLQDVFIQVIERAKSIERPGALLAWIRTVAINECLMRLRSPWRQRREDTEIAEAQEDELDDAARLEGLNDVERALMALAPETRMVIWLHDVEGYTHKEIGDLMGKTASYSKSQLARGYDGLLTRWNAPMLRAGGE